MRFVLFSELADKLGKLCIAAGNVHYKSSEGVIWRAVIQSALGKNDADEQPALFFHNTEAMLSEFKYLGKEKAYEVVVKNTNTIADMVEDNIRPVPKGNFLPHSSGDEKKLRDICVKKACMMYGDKLPVIVQKRLDIELDKIAEIGLSDIFLSVMKTVEFSNDSGYPVCTEGTVGSSFAAFLAGISEIDPLPPHYRCEKCRHSEFITKGSVYSGYDLPPKLCPNCKTEMIRGGSNIFSEAFFGNKKDLLPHIELNFSEDIFENVQCRIGEIFGKNNIISAGRIITVNEKNARSFWKNYCGKRGIQPSPAETERFIYCCTRVKASDLCSPGSVFIIPREYNVCDFTPVQQTGYLRKYDRTASHFDSSALNKTFFKIGLYEHCIPTLYGRLEKLTGIKITAVPINDPEIFKLFISGGTLGIPGFGTEFEMRMLDTVQPECFSDLIKISGLSHGTGTWLNNAQMLIQNKICTLSEVISSQDDIIDFLLKRGFDIQDALDISEAVRSGKADDEICKKLAVRGVPEWYIESCKKIKHLPPKAYSAEYALAAARLAWFKIYKPAEFYAAVISTHISIESETILNGRSAVKQRLTELSEKADITLRERDTAEVLRLAYEMMTRGIAVISSEKNGSDFPDHIIKNGSTEIPFSILNS